MASLELLGFDGLDDAFKRIGNIPWEVTDDALQAMAEVEMRKIIQDGKAGGIYDPKSNIHILDKIKVNKSKKTDAGGHADITFRGTRTRGGKRGEARKTRNAEIAFINEFGKAGQPARPFIKTAIERYTEEIVSPGEKIVGDWIEKEFQS